MNYLSYKTVSVNKENANKKWYVVDAEGQILGRLASQVAMILRGKRKACFTPHSDCGDNVIIINAEKVVLVLEHAVRGMLPKNRLGDAIYRNLYVYEGPNHNHEAQQPIELKINTHKQYKN